MELFKEYNQQSLSRLRSAFDDEASCKMTNHNWFAEFKRGRVNLSDEFRDGRPPTAVNNKNIDAVRRMIETDRLLTAELRPPCAAVAAPAD
ncbi:hypothetical protein EVAR_23443_1 [Eumeta japonica]|uniref:Mos1 transposase HTH domain-containing protein n=1 Tax=Eumeta variegata TaxID=151549 RepID=A0A4C1UJN8_EUMVA|nr:hypothetical protein EVAR_23443_1 [Eumeta japonica]